ncbi:hypothetical protein ABPG72_006810 [Tetrahymena utriculariae]
MSKSINQSQQILNQNIHFDTLSKEAKSYEAALQSKQGYLIGQQLSELKFSIPKSNRIQDQQTFEYKQEKNKNNSFKFIKLSIQNEILATNHFKNFKAQSKKIQQNTLQNYKSKMIDSKASTAQKSPCRNNSAQRNHKQFTGQPYLQQSENVNQQDNLIKSICDRFFYTQRSNPLLQSNFQSNYVPYLKQTQSLEKAKEQLQESQQKIKNQKYEDNQRIKRQKVSLDSLDNTHNKSLKLLRLGDQIKKNPQLYYLKQSAKQREQVIKSQVSISLSKLYASNEDFQLSQQENNVISCQKLNQAQTKAQEKHSKTNSSFLIGRNQLESLIPKKFENKTLNQSKNTKSLVQNLSFLQTNSQHETNDQKQLDKSNKQNKNEIFQMQQNQNISYLYKNKYSINLSQLESINYKQHEVFSESQNKYYRQIQNDILRRNQSQDLNSSKISQGTQTINIDIDIKSQLSSSPSERNSYIASKNIDNLQVNDNNLNINKDFQFKLPSNQHQFQMKNSQNFKIQNKRRGNSVIIEHDQNISLQNNMRRQSFSHLNNSSNTNKKKAKGKEQLNFSKQTYEFLKPTYSYLDQSKAKEKVIKQNSMDQLSHLISPTMSYKPYKYSQKQIQQKSEKLFHTPSINTFHNLQKYKQKFQSNKTVQKISFLQSPIQNIEGYKLLIDKSSKLQLNQQKSLILQQMGLKIIKSKQNIIQQESVII